MVCNRQRHAYLNGTTPVKEFNFVKFDTISILNGLYIYVARSQVLPLVTEEPYGKETWKNIMSYYKTLVAAGLVMPQCCRCKMVWPNDCQTQSGKIWLGPVIKAMIKNRLLAVHLYNGLGFAHTCS